MNHAGWLGIHQHRLGFVTDLGFAPLDGVQDPGPVTPDRVAFATGDHWLVAIPGRTGIQAWISDDGTAWRPLPASPAEAPGFDHLGLFPRAGSVALIAEDTAWLGTSDGWSPRRLPPGATWLGTDGRSSWAVGSGPPRRVRADREATLWRDDGGRWSHVEVRLTLGGAWRALAGGGFESFDAVEPGEPLVLASETAWFLEDPAFFLFVQEPRGRFAVHRLPLGLARLTRDQDGTPIAFAPDGERWRYTGRRWRAAGFASRLRAALDRAGVAGRRAVQIDGLGRVLRAVVRDWPGDDSPTRRQAWASDDEGRSWRRVAHDGVDFVAGWVRPARADGGGG